MADFNSLPPEVQEGILNGPAMPPPNGVKSNFDNPPHQNAAGRAVVSICLAICTIVFFTRCYSVWVVIKKPRLSDYAMVPTYILYVAFSAILYAEIDKGYFVHLWDIRTRDLTPIAYLYINSISLYAATLMMIKVVILLEWLAIFVPRGTRNYFFWTAHALMWVNVGFYVAAIFAVNFSCIPRQKYWDRLMPGHCIATRPLEIASALINFLVDIGILLLPQGVIWKLNIPTQKKFGVSAIFSVGLLAVATAGYRAGFTIDKHSSDDITWDYSLVGLLLAVEITCGTVIFCLPLCPKAISNTGLPSLYSKLKSLVSRNNNSHQKSSGSDNIKNDRNVPRSSHSWPQRHAKADSDRYHQPPVQLDPLHYNNNMYDSNTRLAGIQHKVSADSHGPF